MFEITEDEVRRLREHMASIGAILDAVESRRVDDRGPNDADAWMKDAVHDAFREQREAKT